jgi:UDP-N-acetylmuramoylalanine--D-glutamate ligase
MKPTKQEKTILKNKKITVMGLGLNQGGVGVSRFLARAGAKVLVTDLKSEKELSPSIKKLRGLPIKYVLGRHREQDFKNTDLIIQNPGVPNNSLYLGIAQKHKIPIETDMGIFIHLCLSQNIIGIAGTKGKSTTASLIYHIFKSTGKDVVLAGNIGISVFDSLPFINSKTIVVLEISSWQLEGLKQHFFAPQVAVLTNILQDHLDRYPSFKEYSQAEQLIFKYQNKNDFLVLNRDQKITEQVAKKVKSKIFWFSKKKKIKQGCFVKNKTIICRIGANEKKIIKTTLIPLLGGHNLENILAACVVAMIYGLPVNVIEKAIQRFNGIAHRLQFIKKIKGVKFYNDSAATTPDACLAALNSFNQPIILILGGKDKKMSFQGLVKEIAKNKRIKKVILLQHSAYDASEKILKIIKKHQIEERVVFVSNIKEAVKKAKKESTPADIILFSPAAASFGMFKNEFDRGNQFIKYVQSNL